jgi:iron complex transport system permease protein
MKKIPIILSLLIVGIAPFYGQIDISIYKIFNAETLDYRLFWDLRLPRVILAFFVGGILGLGGLLFQSIFRNSLSTPFTLGVASGATLGSAFAIIFGYLTLVPFFGFLGAFSTIIILFTITTKLKSYETNSLLLVGIALSFFYSAALMVLYYISDQAQSYEIIRFTMGSLDTVGLNNVIPIFLASIFLLILSHFYKSELKLILTSNENAYLKGLNLKKVNTILLLAVSIAVGIAVSITGPIGFIGLIVPHIIKAIYKTSSDKLLMPIFYYSGVFLLFCDLISRNLGTSSDIPIGVVTSFIGGPFFIYLLISRKSK